MAEPAVKQKIRRAIKKAKKILENPPGSADVFEIKNSYYHLMVLRPGHPAQFIRVCLFEEPDPPALKGATVERWNFKNGKFWVKKILPNKKNELN